VKGLRRGKSGDVAVTETSAFSPAAGDGACGRILPAARERRATLFRRL